MEIGLDKAPLFINANTNTKSRDITGGLWLWDGEINNDRVRVTNYLATVGRANQVTGWINISNIKI